MGDVIELRTTSDRATRWNVLGEAIEECSCDPMTGWKRDGTCSTDDSDQGMHVICCLMTDEFLQFSAKQGNDLTTPNLQFGFPGLKAGDRWCLCGLRWLQAFEAGCAPPLFLRATHRSMLSLVSIEDLKKHSIDACH